MEWLRWYHGCVSDPKFSLIARRSGQNVAAVLAVWAALLERASMADVRGCVAGFDCESFDALFGLDDGACQAILSAFESKEMIVGGHIAKWKERQPARERDDDNSAERVRQFRERQKTLQNQKSNEANAIEAPCNAEERHVTPCNAIEAPCNAEERHVTPRLEEKREELRDSSLRSESCPGSGEPDEQRSARPENFSGEKPPGKKGKPKPELPEDSEAYRLAVYMRDRLKANLPTFREPNLQQWARDFDVALRNDERMKDTRFVAGVIQWVTQDSFWRANCQSPGKLREKFDQLTAKMETEAARSRASPASSGFKTFAQQAEAAAWAEFEAIQKQKQGVRQ